MAVLDAYPGLTTEITVNREPLVEYDDDEGETSPTEVTKYIEARTGADFVIKTIFRKPFPTENGVEISCSVDGNRGPCWGIEPKKLMRCSAKKMTGVSFSKHGKRFHQNYQFAELNIVEECDGAQELKSLRKEVECKGCIKVSYRWITNFRPCKERGKSDKPPAQEDEEPSKPLPRRQLPMMGAIPEKALKGDARSHQAILGEPQALKPAKGPGQTYDYVDRSPFGIIRFQYRSLAALKALQIASDEEPEPEHGPSPVAELPITGSIRGELPWPSQRTETRARAVKQEATPQKMKQDTGARSRVKREHNAGEDAKEDSDDLAIVETRSCKRPRADQEVIVLD